MRGKRLLSVTMSLRRTGEGLFDSLKRRERRKRMQILRIFKKKEWHLSRTKSCRH